MTSRTPISDENLSAYLDGELADADRARLLEAILADADARRRLDRDRAIRAALAEELQALGSGDADRFGPAADALVSALSRPRRRLAWRQVAAGAALFVAGWGAHVGYQSWQAWQVPSVVEAAKQAHQDLAYAQAPPEFEYGLPPPATAASIRRLAHWFSDHLGEQVEIPDLRSVGLSFVGGRLLSAEQGPLAQVVYEDARGRRLSLYISPAAAAAGAEIEIVRFDGVDAGYWRDGEMIYTVVAESSVEQVMAVASAIGLSPRSREAER